MIQELRDRLDLYFYWIHERETIRLNKEVERNPQPWTDDPILQKFKFCQVFREEDRTTRWFNFIETGRTLIRHNLHIEWDRKKAIEEITKQDKWVTGAYIVKTPNRMDKVTGVAECISHMWSDREKLVERILTTKSLEKSWEILRDYPYMGPFMAYEVITDLRHTYLLQDAEDILTWANAGPGAMRGLNRLAGRDLDFCRRTHPWNDEMRNLWEISRERLNPNLIDLNRFEMREIEGGLCEFDKYSRILNEEGRTRSVYKYDENLPLIEDI